MSATIYCNRCGFASADDARFCQGCGAAISPLAALAPGGIARSAESFQFAGFWMRTVAALIDFALLFVSMLPIRWAIGSAVTAITMDSPYSLQEVTLVRRWVRIVVAVALGLAYRIGMESSIYQATFGKMAMRLRVTDLEGRRISLGRAVARSLSKWVSVVTLGIGYLMVAFDEEKQALHDRIADTRVLRVQSR